MWKGVALLTGMCFFGGCSARNPGAIADKYENQLVRRPGNSPEDSKVYVVLDHKRCWILHSEWLGRHGYKWPGDVKTIPASELERIPLGEPLP